MRALDMIVAKCRAAQVGTVQELPLPLGDLVRIQLLLASFERILGALRTHIDDIDLALPSAGAVPSLSHLKRYEDALDGLVSAWVGIEYLEGRAQAYGDATAAIWVPTTTG